MKSYENVPEEVEALAGIEAEEIAGPGDDRTVIAAAPATDPVVEEDHQSEEGLQGEEIAAPSDDGMGAASAAVDSHAEDEEVIETEGEREGVEKAAQSFFQPSREQLVTAIAFWGVILLGALLRFWGLGDKPLHHDESLHAYFSLQLMHNLENWSSCVNAPVGTCYHYDPLLHGPFQFHMIAFIYKVSQLLGAPDHGVNTTTVRIGAATLGTVIVGLPYFLRDYLGRIGAWLGCFLLAISPSLVYFSRFAREDIYMACFTLLFVVSAGRYIRSRRAYWLALAAIGFTLSYATKEATFLSIAVFGSFLGAALVWEVGKRIPLPGVAASEASGRTNFFVIRTLAPMLLAGYFILLGAMAYPFFGMLKQLSIYITASQDHTKIADEYVQTLKDRTVQIFPWLGIALAVLVLVLLLREQYGKVASAGRRGLAVHVDPKKQPLLDTFVTMPWTHWFFAVMSGITIFLVLFTVLFTNIRGGIGDGIWQGLYYWIQQQQVARGGQPWYYYFLLIPLYEQIGLVFGCVGVIRCLLQPSRFRLFLVYWLAGNVFIYSWAGEKMPWLMIHMTMPMMLLAAIGLEPVVLRLVILVQMWMGRPSTALLSASGVMERPVVLTQPEVIKRGLRVGRAICGLILAVFLLVLTLQNMYQVNYVHYADAPHEMMIYVQTTSDVNTVMAKVDALDQKLYQGKHALAIGVTDDATWPFAWYVRDYTNVCFQFPRGCPANADQVAVIITGGDALASWQQKYSVSYNFKEYRLRTQWDQGYMPQRCIVTKAKKCETQQYTGSGPLLWLSYGDRYGDTPPADVQFNVGLAVSNVWQWWWQRKPIGNPDGSYDMGFFVRKNLNAAP